MLFQPSISVRPFLFVFHFNKSFVCDLTSLFLNLLFLGEIMEFFLTFIPGVIPFFSRYPKFVFVSWAPSARTNFHFFTLFFSYGTVFKTCLTSFLNILLSCTFSSVTSKARISFSLYVYKLR